MSAITAASGPSPAAPRPRHRRRDRYPNLGPIQALRRTPPHPRLDAQDFPALSWPDWTDSFRVDVGAGQGFDQDDQAQPQDLRNNKGA